MVKDWFSRWEEFAGLPPLRPGEACRPRRMNRDKASKIATFRDGMPRAPVGPKAERAPEGGGARGKHLYSRPVATDGLAPRHGGDREQSREPLDAFVQARICPIRAIRGSGAGNRSGRRDDCRCFLRA